MTASEDPAPTTTSTPAAGPGEQRDDLEHWLSDLRTDVAVDPPGWIDAEPQGEPPARQPPDVKPVPQGQAAAGVSRPKTVGRHRSPD